MTAENTPRSARESSIFVGNPYIPNLDSKLESLTDVVGALRNSASTVALLSDLFGGNMDGYGYRILESDNARTGMFYQLDAIATLLKACADTVGRINHRTIKPDNTVEVAIPLTGPEFLALDLLAKQRGISMEAMALEMVDAGRRAVELKLKN